MVNTTPAVPTATAANRGRRAATTPRATDGGTAMSSASATSRA
jgi:hypothetical protein